MDLYSSTNDQPFVKKSISKIKIDIIKYMPAKLLAAISGLILIPIYTNLLSPQQLGLYSVAMAIISFLPIVFGEWVGLVSLRFLNEHQGINSTRNFFSTLALLLTINLGLMFIFCCFFFEPLTKYFNAPLDIFLLVLVLIIPLTLKTVLFQILRAQIKPLTYTNFTILNQFLIILLAILFVSVFKLGTVGILIAMIISMIATDILLVINTKTYKLVNFREVKINLLRSFYKYGIPIAVVGLGLWILEKTNIAALQEHKSLYLIGLLKPARDISFSILLPIFSVLSLAAMPRIINKYNLGIDIRPVINRISEYYILLFSPFTLILCLYPKEIMTLASAHIYKDSYVLLPFLAISAFFSGLTDYTTMQYHLTKKTYIDTAIRLLSAGIGLIEIIFLVQPLGIWAVGISMITSYLIYFMLSITITNNHLCWEAPMETIILTAKSLTICLVWFLMNKFVFTHSANPDFTSEVTVMLSIYFLSILINKLLAKD